MAEDAYRKYKEDQATVSAIPRAFGDTNVLRVLKGRRVLRRTTAKPAAADYKVFKATIASAVEEIKLEIHDQHQQTRAEVQTVGRDVLAAVKASPAESVKLVCEFGSLALLFALAVRFALKIELVNTAFALFMLTVFALYWIMAKVKQRSEKRAEKNENT